MPTISDFMSSPFAPAVGSTCIYMQCCIYVGLTVDKLGTAVTSIVTLITVLSGVLPTAVLTYYLGS